MPGGDLAPRQQLPGAPRQEEERALSGKKNRGGQDPRRESEAPEPVEEAKGSPGDPASLEQTGEDPGTIEEQPPIEEEPGDVEEALAALAEELEGTRRERDEYLDALQRLKAEFENSRKRQERERARILETASERLV